MLMSPKSLNRNTRHYVFRQWEKRTKKKLSEESPSRSTRTTTDWVSCWMLVASRALRMWLTFLQVIF